MNNKKSLEEQLEGVQNSKKSIEEQLEGEISKNDEEEASIVNGHF